MKEWQNNTNLLGYYVTPGQTAINNLIESLPHVPQVEIMTAVCTRTTTNWTTINEYIRSLIQYFINLTFSFWQFLCPQKLKSEVFQKPLQLHSAHGLYCQTIKELAFHWVRYRFHLLNSFPVYWSTIRLLAVYWSTILPLAVYWSTILPLAVYWSTILPLAVYWSTILPLAVYWSTILKY